MGLTPAVRLRRERDFGSGAVFVLELELALKFVADQGADDREACARGFAVDAGSVVGDGEEDLAVVSRQLDVDSLAAVLEGVLQQLAEYERKRCRAISSE